MAIDDQGGGPAQDPTTEVLIGPDAPIESLADDEATQVLASDEATAVLAGSATAPAAPAPIGPAIEEPTPAGGIPVVPGAVPGSRVPPEASRLAPQPVPPAEAEPRTEPIPGTGPPHRIVAEGDLDWPVRDVRVDGVTELRVHGVGGTPPQAMLGDPHVRQITGDRIAGMWRGTDRHVNGQPRWHREAYSWGGLTSRALASALWLTLVPFALLNQAGWMALGRPRTEGRRIDWRVPYQQSLIRVVSLAATWTYVLFAAQIAMDLGAWQCTQIGSCRLRSWPSGVWPLHGQLSGHPARAVVVASIVPLAVIGGLFALTLVSRRRYEAYGGERRLPDIWHPGASLFTPTFWRGAAYARRSRWLHLWSSVVLVAMLLVAVAHQAGTRDAEVRRAAWACGGYLAVCAVIAGWEGGRRAVLDGPVRQWLVGLVGLGLFGYAAYLAWVQPAPVVPDNDPGIMGGILEGFNIIVVGTYAVGLIHAAVAASARFSARRGRRRLPLIPSPFTALSISVWLIFAVWAGITIWVARWLSTSAVPQTEESAGSLVYPLAYMVLAQLTIVAVAAIAAVAVLSLGTSYGIRWLVSRWRRFPTLAAELRHWAGLLLPGGVRAATPVRRRFRWFGQATKPSRWLGTVRDYVWFANVSRWIERGLGLAAFVAVAGSVGYSVDYGRRWLGRTDLLWTVLYVLVVCAGLTVLAWLAARSRPVDTERRGVLGWLAVLAGLAVFAASVGAGWAGLLATVDRFPDRPAPQPLPDWFPTNPGLASSVLTSVPLLAVLVVRQAIRSPRTRRIVGIGWDVATFWPRSFHPLAPPSYAERAVPELAIRLRHLLGRGAVVVAGHSQGAVVATAALAQLADLPAEQRARLSVVTYGNPTGHLYGRFFPHYVNSATIEAVRCTGVDRAGLHWTNFYRHTDPIGRAVFTPDARGPEDPPTEVVSRHGDVWLPDPPTDWYRRGDGPPRIRSHAHDGYERQSPFAAHLEREVHRLDARAP